VKRISGDGADVAIEALGTQDTFENALRCLRPGGTLSSLGADAPGWAPCRWGKWKFGPRTGLARSVVCTESFRGASEDPPYGKSVAAMISQRESRAFEASVSQGPSTLTPERSTSHMTRRHDVIVSWRNTAGACGIPTRARSESRGLLHMAEGPAATSVDLAPGQPEQGPTGTEAERCETMGILAWIVVGAIAGFIASFLTGAREGIVMTIVLGIIGALVGGFLAGAFLNVKDPTGINVETIVVSVIGAVIVVFVAGLFGSGGRRRPM
jgi:uncharacterized membrane protein YeaQ/YmgE (transglycosylase-associated protein family)